MWNDFPSNDIQQPESGGSPDGSGGPGSYGPSSGASGFEERGYGSPGSGNTFSARRRQIGMQRASMLDIPYVDFGPVEQGVSRAPLY